VTGRDRWEARWAVVSGNALVDRLWCLLVPTVFLVFAGIEVVTLVSGGLGSDAMIYHRAGANWLSGSNPWDASATFSGRIYHFYAAPTAAIVMAPLSLIPLGIFVPGWIALQAASAVFVVRRLELPVWWLLFPPIVSGVLSGNPSLSVLALLLLPFPAAGALAAMVKAYAGVPLLGERRWGAIILSAVLVVASALIAPSLWSTFFGDASARTARLMTESDGGFSGLQDPRLFVLALTSIVVIAWVDFRRAAWLAPVVLWPASQLHWSTLAMPVMTTLLALGLAFPMQQVPVVVISAHALWLVWRRTQRRRS
jgi:hypothetical protein